MDWRSFWNEDHAIYVNARHRAVHAALVARGILSLVPPGLSRTLDWGCGEAEGAGDVAERCTTLYLYDSAPRVRENLRRRYAGSANIRVLDDAAFAALPDGSLDAITIVSVVQYLARDVLADTLDALRPKLAVGSRLVIADVIPPKLSPFVDAKALLMLALHNGFVVAALLGLVRTFVSNYRTLRGKLGLTQWSEQAMRDLLREHGFDASRAEQNIGHNQARMTFVARRQDEAGDEPLAPTPPYR